MEGYIYPIWGMALIVLNLYARFRLVDCYIGGAAMDGCLPDPEPIVVKSHVNSGHASAQQLKRVLVDSSGGNMHMVKYVGAALGKRDACRPFDAAPHVPIAWAPALSMFNGELQVDPLFLGDLIASRVIDAFSKYSHLLPFRSKNPKEVRDASYGARIAIFGQPKCIRMDEGGE